MKKNILKNIHKEIAKLTYPLQPELFYMLIPFVLIVMYLTHSFDTTEEMLERLSHKK